MLAKSRKVLCPTLPLFWAYFQKTRLFFYERACFFKDTCRENAPSNNTKALTKSMDMDIWIVGSKWTKCHLWTLFYMPSL